MHIYVDLIILGLGWAMQSCFHAASACEGETVQHTYRGKLSVILLRSSQSQITLKLSHTYSAQSSL